ncbi:uncharacterized protein A4U43_C01F10110 [Asparagus officinalis]|uniref:Beta-galactosidase n=1 Tax=Asparagus officinalis TaxID=4686 RepID=A0A5P1FSU5_ASPOF|nr:uncharacterized protein A4U43_C01F10110 [Asparagus officinalis]
MAFSKSVFLTLAIFLACFSLRSSNAADVSHDGRAIKIDGQRRILISGSIHYPRSTPQMWPELIAKAKEGGLDAIETYVFWNAHEPQRRQYNFEGSLNIIRFLKEIKSAGLYAVLRIGPYVCAEWNHGGLPAWLQKTPGMQFRTDNQPFKNEMQIFVTKIVNMVKAEGLLAPQGGPVILTQIENEYGNIEGPYGDAGKRYVQWSAKMAEALNVGVPWIMCQQDDAPQPMINTCNGFYCHDFEPNNKNSPKMWTENWTGWFKNWDAPDPHRPAEDVAYAVARFFQTGGTLQNYYMVTKFSGNNVTSACFLSNEGNSTDATFDYEGKSYFLPAWSVSILADCKEEIYNTAKVDTQTTVKVKKPNLAEDESKLTWSWAPEILTNQVKGKNPSLKANKLLEQVKTTADASDYLWYITSVDNLQEGKMTLRVNTTGHGLYVFVNGALIGSQYALNDHFSFIFESTIDVKGGTNVIALLSATVGLKNYGSFYETTPVGISGPVQLIAGNTAIDLSNNQWSYKIGIDGLGKQLHLKNQHIKWHSRTVPTKRPFTWYKTNFEAPLGSDPVVVDLQGMGKGMAWVNGENIGRYWPKITATSKNCTACDYRGEFTADRSCNTGCNEPGQRWYHVPREYLKPGKTNTLILFEEFGGNPSSINFQTVVVGTICATVNEKETLNLTCEGGKISGINFAGFGNPQGTCQAFTKGTCEAPGTLEKVKQECIGKLSCSILADEGLLGACTPCGNVTKKLAVQATCS